MRAVGGLVRASGGPCPARRGWTGQQGGQPPSSPDTRELPRGWGPLRMLPRPRADAVRDLQVPSPLPASPSPQTCNPKESQRGGLPWGRRLTDRPSRAPKWARHNGNLPAWSLGHPALLCLKIAVSLETASGEGGRSHPLSRSCPRSARAVVISVGRCWGRGQRGAPVGGRRGRAHGPPGTAGDGRFLCRACCAHGWRLGCSSGRGGGGHPWPRLLTVGAQRVHLR